MPRKRIPMTKAQLLDRLHRGLRPKLRQDQTRDLGLVHNQNLDAVARGTADEQVLWDVVESIHTWSRVADLLERGVDEMRAQLEMATALVERYGRTGRVGFSGVEYQLAKRGVVVMDMLAEITDRGTAIAAADWSEARMRALQAPPRHVKPAAPEAMKYRPSGARVS